MHASNAYNCQFQLFQVECNILFYFTRNYHFLIFICSNYTDKVGEIYLLFRESEGILWVLLGGNSGIEQWIHPWIDICPHHMPCTITCLSFSVSFQGPKFFNSLSTDIKNATSSDFPRILYSRVLGTSTGFFGGPTDRVGDLFNFFVSFVKTVRF